MLDRTCRQHCLLPGIALALSTQVLIVRSEVKAEAAGEATQETLKAQVLALGERERSQVAEIADLRRRLASYEIEVRHGGQTKRRRPQELSQKGARKLEDAERAVRGNQSEEGGGEKKEETEAEKESEKLEEEEEEDEEEEHDPVEVTLAVSLLGYITMVMMLFWIVNYPDPDMKYYVWGVLSNTLSIFLAVLTFTLFNDTCERLTPEGASDWAKIGVQFAELCVCFTAMQCSVAYISGSFDAQPFLPEDTEPKMSIDAQKRQKERWFKSVATLLAHMSGFSAISFGGSFQDLPEMQANPPLLFLVPPVLFIGQLLACRGVRKIRRHLIKKILDSHGQRPDAADRHTASGGGNFSMLGAEPDMDGEGGIIWCVDRWDEETYESENEVSALATSFLLLQACRYNVTGVMPDRMGIEEPFMTKTQPDVYYLIVIGFVLAFLCVVVVVTTSDVFGPEAKIAPGTLMSLLKRCVLVFQSSLAMGFAWALMIGSKWQITLLLPGLNPNNVTSRVLLALTISGIAFCIILALDKIADLKSTGQKTDKAIRRVIDALSILVGFTWEQCFDGAVEVVATVTSVFKGHTVMAEFLLTACIFGIVYPQWRKQILSTMLDARDSRDKFDEDQGIRATQSFH